MKPSFALVGEVVAEQSTFRRLVLGGQKVSVLGYVRVPAPLRMSTMSEPRANKRRGRQRRPRGGGGSSMGASVLMPLSFQYSGSETVFSTNSSENITPVKYRSFIRAGSRAKLILNSALLLSTAVQSLS